MCNQPYQPYQQFFHVLRSPTEIPDSEINKLSNIFHPVKPTHDSPSTDQTISSHNQDYI
ncbi:hypothetical protein [Sphaerospermopsis aphanizomenoides]|jgi:hypothetical protein|uniref:hypothetical protein n=1 Tax=Sphaerospermopsis aphanizomenoides TaxID=459663 RepID=UPI0018829BE1|nr:hypothetical protein [Sphaerospermopsis aphanizomenoides]